MSLIDFQISLSNISFLFKRFPKHELSQVIGIYFHRIIVRHKLSKKEKDQFIDQYHAAYYNKLSKNNKFLSGTSINFIDSLINTNPFIQKVLLSISTKNDCLSCIEKGSESLEGYQHHSSKTAVFEVHFKPEKINLKTELGFGPYTLNSKDGFIRDFESLINRYPTSILMFYVEDKGIQKIHCIPTFNDENQRNNFLK